MTDEIAYLRLRGRYASFLKGDITVDDLDDEELAQGRLKAVDGSFRGRPPMVIPTEMVNAMRKEWLSRAEGTLREALMSKGIKVLTDLAGNEAIDPAVRLRASQVIIERTMGKVPDRVHIAADDSIEGLFQDLLRDPKGLDPLPEPDTKTTLEMLL